MARAKVTARALHRAHKVAEEKLPVLRKRITSARRYRLGSQLFSAVCSSSVVLALLADKQSVEQASAVLALLATLGILIAEYREGDDGIGGNAREAYTKLYENTNKASLVYQE